ncbi:methyl-accepting chemotaxis protein [uncultured Kiloniella sp.]|uniref:methyl-accepting chemotaxis protein n=1 Tax=uncultured Kiloniella sp. TaxID=1133091 RepID=UPI002639D91C|nr:HAMP domain-containing methyl-accepting chemotaxis protein [uncultured Kiloniella sp.]
MITAIKSRIDIKLIIALITVLVPLMAGLLFGFELLMKNMMKKEEARTQLLREMNQTLRAEITDLQTRYLSIGTDLEVNASKEIETWALSQGASVTIHDGRNGIKARYKKRNQRRDLSKNGFFVLDEGSGKPSVSLGVFAGSKYQDKVKEFRFDKLVLADIEREVARISQENSGDDALGQKVLSLKGILADATLEAEQKRIAILQHVDVIREKDEEVKAFADLALMISISLGGMAVVLILGVIFGVNRSLVTRSLVRLQAAAREVADGGNVQLREASRIDEIGSLARGVERFQQARDEAAVLREENERERLRNQKAVEDRLVTVASQLESGMNSSVKSVTLHADDLAIMSDQLQNFATNTNQQAGETIELADINAKMAGEIRELSENLVSCSSEMSEAVDQQIKLTSLATKDTKEAHSTVEDLYETANQVEEIIEMIQKIAGQTHLLALNATIEASRAGVAGAGFAVVAEEVKKLSAETSQATDAIAVRVKSIRDVSEQAAKGITTIEGRINQVDQSMRGLVQLFEAQSNASTGIARFVKDSVENANKVSGSTAAMRDASRTTGDATDKLMKTSDMIKSALGHMQNDLRLILNAASSPV